LLRIRRLRFFRRHTEKRRIEEIDPLQQGARPYVIWTPGRLPVDARLGQFLRSQPRHRLHPGAEIAPERFKVWSTGKTRSHAHDGDVQPIARLGSPLLHPTRSRVACLFQLTAADSIGLCIVRSGESGGQRMDGGISKQVHHRHLPAGHCPHLRQHLRQQQGMPSEVEKIIVDTDAANPQDLFPYRRHRPFAVVARRSLRRQSFWFGSPRRPQRLPVDLSTRSHGKGLQEDPAARHHVVREPLREKAAKVLPRNPAGRAGNDVPHQPGFGRPRLSSRAQPQQSALGIAQPFDPLEPLLHVTSPP